jgi:hypothetical protein
MPEIIPRWEWRTFGNDFGEAEMRLRSQLEANPEAKVRESVETYVVSAASGSNTKVRDMLMDIKRLLQANQDRLEQWDPVLKTGFPMLSTTVFELFRVWNVPVPQLNRSEYSFDQLLQEVVKPHADLRAILVQKQRHGATINGCIVEIADLRFDGTPISTVAVEMEDPGKVIETVRQLGLERFENINYVKALKRFKGISEA